MKSFRCLGVLCALGLAVTPSFAGGFFELDADRPQIVLTIENRGDITLTLFRDEAPKTVERIIALAKSGFYDGQKVVDAIRKPRPFAVKFGDPLTKTAKPGDTKWGTGGSGVRIARETNALVPQRGMVGLSTQDGSDFGDSQFFVLLADANFLKGNYTFFGQVTKGMDVLDTLAQGDLVSRAVVR
jgi:cyclophilin family peptidyl-prolyl cis-trans isomerase